MSVLRVSSVLYAAARVFDDAGWTKGANARNADGRDRNASNPESVCFCVWGAVRRVAENELTSENRVRLLDALESEAARRGERSVFAWNDTACASREDAQEFLMLVARQARHAEDQAVRRMRA